jgi:uridine phosphorylase
MPVGEDLQKNWRAWIKAGCLASEMESATLYIVAQVLRVRAGCVLNTVWNQERAAKGLSNPEVHDTTPAIKTAIEAVRVLLSES